MCKVINVDFRAGSEDSIIDVNAVARSVRSLRDGLIAPATENTSYEIANEHTSEPIKNVDDIYAISEWFLSRGRYRDNMLFIVGINFGLRVSDLLTLRFSHIIDEQFRFKTTFPILERKTKNTRKVRKNRYITINDAVVDAVTLYLENTPDVRLSDFMFRGTSNRCGKDNNKALTRKSADRIMKEVGEALGLDIHIATHTLRKTFAYHQMVVSGNDPRKLLLLQKMFGHSTSAQTLDYIGITGEEIEDAYLKLNLGGRSKLRLMDSTIIEQPAG